MASNAAADYRRVTVTALGGWLERGWEHFAATKAISMSFSAVFLLPWLAAVYVLLDRGVLLLGYALVGALANAFIAESSIIYTFGIGSPVVIQRFSTMR